ncbi:ABC-F family ATP-binding cassette domain-containing protein [Pyxidicoccus xibeiensis]|uniref:ABC-F family ATP-binding cassette domain-containing protein n=1 Tax=Pyxidicoccus xibeiensis TaxID=2906759 RepID=UPI0020A7E177|nr:ATP-binding cassette domain-containing protein [Pyxidicoccus xibeiensis]MCP3144709.1 ABC-F family ATP-binding cassette domain-containing protein [Pyxidicoccus xibeiensis]
MTLLRAANVQLSFGSRTVFQGLTFTIEEGERVGLVGVNGSGKSSLMKILAGAAKADTGELQLRRGARVTYLPQEPEFPEGATVESELSVSQGPLKEALAAHAELAKRLESSPAEGQEKLLEQFSALSDRIEQMGGWDTEHHAKMLLDRLGVKEWDKPVAVLSGGLRKRVAIARALLTRPDLLLLDEPTNHLDADTVDWLEEELDKLPGALLLVTHDRYFLDGLVDRIVEIQPGEGVTSYPGNYQAYVEQKLVAQQNAELSQHKRERWIAQEVAWLRRGPEARRTKSKARIDRAQKLMAEKGFQRPKVADLRVASAPRLGHTVIEAEGLRKSFGDKPVLQGVDFRLQRGERVGLVGPNGVGKTTFLRVLLGELAPDGGKLVIGKNTKVAYYDQARAQLDLESTVYESASQGEDWVILGTEKVALRDYLEDLLFPVPMQKMKVKALSGGERNRLLLARLFLEGANVLVLDEPTNDLDIVTLNILERLLLDFGGSTLLVTHDRYFLDKVATSILTFEGGGRVTRYEGNYAMYRRLKEQAEAQAAAAASAASAKPAPKKDEPAAPAASSAKAARKPGKLTYKEQRELDGMEAAIEAAETKKAGLEAQLADPAVYSNGSKVAEVQKELETTAAEVDRLYARWQELQDLAAGGAA